MKDLAFYILKMFGQIQCLLANTPSTHARTLVDPGCDRNCCQQCLLTACCQPITSTESNVSARHH